MQVQFPLLLLPRFRPSLAGRHFGPARQAVAERGRFPSPWRNARRAGWPWRLPTKAPRDLDVLALEDPVPQPTASLSPGVPEAIRPSSVNMRENIDVFSMFPSVEPADRRVASLLRVFRGDFPCFNGTIEALRFPDAHPNALRCLRLAVPPCSLVIFAPLCTGVPPGQGVFDPVSPTGISQRERQNLPSS
jgi:hypothetical protein